MLRTDGIDLKVSSAIERVLVRTSVLASIIAKKQSLALPPSMARTMMMVLAADAEKSLCIGGKSSPAPIFELCYLFHFVGTLINISFYYTLVYEFQ